ncbi:hypothetical protein JTG35_004784 [Salmonella enterica]|nr:hypothetical protein [Escherichia coli]EHC4127691.1 hypothetical protein [Salmonella enterica]EHC4128146.1 hypothetical protein [Salmonella enterica]
MVTLKAHILPHHDLQPPGCRGSYHGDDDNGMMLSDGVTVRAVMMDDVIA